ncbi:MAG: peptide chain release factor N(5)-glutamine methyltransferase [Planctomycetes bacterium]|nr:peptide chain release factor N(5)-glutamine methyltransferase [Planctomycetota bacterium]
MAEQPSQPWTVLRLLNWTKEHFERIALEDARLSAEVLLSHVLACTRIELYARFDQQPDEQALAEFRRLVKRAGNHEPIAYLVGYKEFYSLRFRVGPDVLIPRSETEILVGEAVTHLSALSRPARMWDVCTGSGCVAVAVAVNADSATILATDISQPALATAAQNAADHDVAGRVTFERCDLLDRTVGGQAAPFDVITANPPYVALADEVGPSVKYEPREALYAGHNGMARIRPIIQAAPRFLRPGGVLIMEFGFGQADAVHDQILATGSFDPPRIIRDLQGIERAVAAIRK